MPISRHLLMCYHAIFRRTDFQGKYLAQWVAFALGHFENGLRIQTFQDFYDHFGVVLGLFRQHNFIQEYDSVYQGESGYAQNHLTTEQCEINLHCLRGWIETAGAHDVEDDISSIVSMHTRDGNSPESTLVAIETEILPCLQAYAPRAAFDAVDSLFNTDGAHSPRRSDDADRHAKENVGPRGDSDESDSEQDEIESVTVETRPRQPARFFPRANVRVLLEKMKALSRMKATGMICGAGPNGDAMDEERATTRRVVRPSEHRPTGGVRFANPDISYVDCAIEVDVKTRGLHSQSIQPEKTVDGGGIPVYTYRLTVDDQHDVYVENRSGRDIVMQHAYIGEDRCEERREIFNQNGREMPGVFITLGVGDSVCAKTIRKESGESMDGVDIRTVVGRTVLKLRFVVV